MNDQNLIQEFLLESYENLEQLDRDLVALEINPSDHDQLANIFRTFHNIKGACGYFGFAKLEAVCHRGENLLSRLRDGKLLLRPEITTPLLALIDAVREMLGDIGRTGKEGDRDYTSLLTALTSLQEGMGAVTPMLLEPATFLPCQSPEIPAAACTQPTQIPLPPSAPTAKVDTSSSPPLPGAGLMSEGSNVPTMEGTYPASVLDNIRVDVGRLDKLMNLVGELVLARNRILQFTVLQKEPAFLAAAQRLNLVTSELQQGIMKTRLQPISAIWNKFPRVARDLALDCGKQVAISVEGADTELDKSVIDTLKDPLIHLVRNAIDHGIETPQTRRAHGKQVEGRLSLRASHEGGLVKIEVADDGAGIDPKRIRQKALERALITEEQAAHMSDRDLLHLVFLPGFSTSEKVSKVSGRGVGMDVVKTNIEKVGGMVDLDSRPTVGTTVTIKIPLTLAIIPALIVTSRGDRYAIPQDSLLELVRVEEGTAARGIEWIHGDAVYRLRDKLLPLLYLDRELSIESHSGSPNPMPVVHIVVLQAGDRQFGLVVDSINDTEEIVVKPLGAHVKSISLFAGATILGDGKVVLILDILGLARKAGVIAEMHDWPPADKVASSCKRPDDRQAFLLLGMKNGRRVMVPLALVSRLEELPRAAVERAAHQEVMQYRGRILPLVRLGETPGTSPDGETERESLQLVVCTDHGHQIGLVADRILDVIETESEVQCAARGEGILGSAVVGQQVTDLLDIPGIIRTTYPAPPATRITVTRA